MFTVDVKQQHNNNNLFMFEQEEPQKFRKGRNPRNEKGKEIILILHSALIKYTLFFKFHYDIPKGYIVIGCAKIVLKINQRDITPKISKVKERFLYETRCLNCIYIAIDSPKPYIGIECNRIAFQTAMKVYFYEGL